MTDYTDARAVEAAAAALPMTPCEWHGLAVVDGCDDCEYVQQERHRNARRALTAAAPILLAAERRRIAAEARTEAEKFERAAQFESHHRRTQLFGHAAGLTHAARIAEGEA